MNTLSTRVTDPMNTSLRSDVIKAIQQKGELAHYELKIHARHGTVIVEGDLPAYYLRQVALECIKRVSGVTTVVDRIRVTNESKRTSEQSESDNIDDVAD